MSYKYTNSQENLILKPKIILLSLLFSRCIYILPKDIQKEANVLDIIPYALDVDVIKDCSTLRNEIADVFSVISRDNGTYFTLIEKVSFF